MPPQEPQGMKTTTMITILVVAAIFFAVSYYSYKNMPGSGTSTGNSSTEKSTGFFGGSKDTVAKQEQIKPVIVIYTDKGFSPDSIEIAAGGSVAFVNGSTGSMWVKSDDLKELDENISVQKGGGYQFKFDKVGTWTYYNKDKPGQKKGTVIVK